MNLVLDSTFKRIVFFAVIIGIDIIFLFSAFFQFPHLHQQTVTIYLLVVQVLVVLTFFAFRDQHAYRHRTIKKLKNPRLQENSFVFSDLLMQDYQYIRETAAQAMNDRHTMVNYFLLIVGAVTTIALTTLDAGSFQVPITGTLLLIVALLLHFTGWIFFMKLIRLRQAWCGSALAMNQIKEFYIINGRLPDDIARSAFLWDTKSIPAPGRKSNVFYYSSVLISLVTSAVLMFASVVSAYTGLPAGVPLFSSLLGLYHFLFQVLSYSLFLDYSNQRR